MVERNLTKIWNTVYKLGKSNMSFVRHQEKIDKETALPPPPHPLSHVNLLLPLSLSHPET